jgi:hypothetical protein
MKRARNIVMDTAAETASKKQKAMVPKSKVTLHSFLINLLVKEVG